MIYKTHQGLYFEIDREDLERVRKHLWRTSNTGHFTTCIDGKTVALHNFVLNHEPVRGIVTDHIDMNPANNMKSNLRIVKKSINSYNVGKKNFTNATSKFKGVVSANSRFKANSAIMGKQINLGVFKDETEAAMAYNLFILRFIGDNIAINDVGIDYNFYIPFPSCDEEFPMSHNIQKRENGKYRYIIASSGQRVMSATVQSYQDAFQIKQLFLLLLAKTLNVSLRGYDHRWNYYENMQDVRHLIARRI